MTSITNITEIIHYAIAVLLFALAGFAVASAFMPPRDEVAEARLFGFAVFMLALGFVVGLRP